MKVLSVVLLGLLTGKTFAWSTASEFECGATNALVHREILLSDAFAEELDAFELKSIDPKTKVSAQIVKGVMCFDKYESTMDELWISRGISVASNACQSIDLTSSDWQYWHSRLLLLGGYALLNENLKAYSFGTNCLSIINASDFSDSTNIVAKAFLRHTSIEDLTVRQSLQLSVAMIAAKNNETNSARAASANLPASYRSVVEEILSEHE